MDPVRLLIIILVILLLVGGLGQWGGGPYLGTGWRGGGGIGLLLLIVVIWLIVGRG